MGTLHAIVLAAGEGTRMKSERPKVLHEICGRAMIGYALDLVAMAGVKQPVVVTGLDADAVKAALPKDAKVVVQAKARGTGDAVLAARRALGSTGDVLIIYADAPLLRRGTIQRLVESHNKVDAACTLLTAHLADPGGYGRIVRNELGQVTGIVEDADANAAQRAIREVNVGPLVCKVPALLAALAAAKPSGATKELYLTEMVSHIAKQEGAKIHTARVEEVAEALGINTRADLSRAIQVIRQRIIDTHLHNGVTIEDPQTTYIEYGVSIGRDTVIHPCTVIHSGVSIGRNCSIGPFARLRGGVTVGEDVRLGNFVELVRTSIGPHVRMSHMSYLGDATVDESVNIGAGTITANYDGKDKYPTHIGKGAFIGSDTVLIAPVKVGSGAVTGAGCVVPRGQDVPPRTVVVGVPARALNGKPEPRPAAPVQPSASGRGASAAAKPTKRAKTARRAATRKAAARPARKPRTRSTIRRRVTRAGKRPAARRPRRALARAGRR